MGDQPLTSATAGPSAGTGWSPWRTVVAFGLVSLLADMVYEGMRSVAGPYLGTLGASAVVVGLVTGAGEAMALLLRLGTGPWADRSGRHWRLTVVGYALTAVCVPLLALAPALGTAGVAVAAALILAERAGKAIRSPAKSALLARVAAGGSLGRAFGVHKALDQVGAFAGPLVVAGVAALTGVLWPGFAVLAVPGALSLLVLAQLARRALVLTAAVAADESSEQPNRPVRRGLGAALGVDLPARFHVFSAAAALATAGLMTFGIISFRFVETGLVPLAAAPVVYALAMATAAVAALGTGVVFDRWGPRVLLVVPVLVAVLPPLVFADRLAPVLAGVALWGVATGILDSTVKAQVAAVVPDSRRATGYGVFAAVQGLGAIAGGVVAGALVTDHATVLAVVVALAQVAALVLLVGVLRTRR
ncbi:MFS transporter [Pimelobacter simplex]|uniref:MFS transporter n=1 Tax=Nocardioides simplex TaxID=2045 RepID=UPI00214FB9E8|nr:MFS transporter [Pimelobacter simplex]UUW88219.1 MFS transporter [Pimelobacter simplex]UUW97724.1 MFS transporter [Pimelobacter simplex]